MENALELLKKSRIEVSPELFHLISLTHEDWFSLLENPEHGPRMSVPFMIFRDGFEVTLLFDEVDFASVRHLIPNAKRTANFRLLTFDIELGFEVVGFTSAVSKILADAAIPIVPLSAFSRDHILIQQSHLADALRALREFVEDIC